MEAMQQYLFTKRATFINFSEMALLLYCNCARKGAATRWLSDVQLRLLKQTHIYIWVLYAEQIRIYIYASQS